jgi:cytochrome c oxidase assembly protein subunit 15
VPCWLRAWAWLAAIAALPLVTLGAEVTTKSVGMVDPKGFRAPWHLFTLSRDQLSLGVLIEHGHRLAGFIVGIACIILAVGLLLQARGWFHRSLGFLALGMVTLQGLLGIFRVNLHDWLGMGPTLALIHGCFAQLTFATLVAVAVLCSRAFWAATTEAPQGLRTASLALCLLVYVQVVFGAALRHLLDPSAQRLHMILAFGVVLGVFWLVWRLRDREDKEKGERRGVSPPVENINPAPRLVGALLLGLVLLQPILGVEAWIRRFGAGTLPELLHSSPDLDLARSAHHVVGTLIFATTVALAVLLHRRGEVAA